MQTLAATAAEAASDNPTANDPPSDTEPDAGAVMQYLGRYRRDVYQGLESSGFVDVPKEGGTSIRRSGRTRQPTFAELQAFNKPAVLARPPVPRCHISYPAPCHAIRIVYSVIMEGNGTV